MTTTLSAPPVAKDAMLDFVDDLRGICRRALPEMFLTDQELFCFTKRRTAEGIRREGVSRRYTAITLLGLIGEADAHVRSILHGRSASDLCGRLLRDVESVENMGDVALTLWCANLIHHPDRERAAARLRALDPVNAPHYVVELAWALSALANDRSMDANDAYRRAVAQRLMSVFSHRGDLFPHNVGSRPMLRAHVGCFADQVYPIQALSFYATATRDDEALNIANRTAAKICHLLGPAGQWWWHYDARTGDVVEGYPVYSVHQNSMAPMALFAVQEAGGDDYWPSIVHGLKWLQSPPELHGRSLVDHENNLIWRKVARREPNKLTRRLQAGVSAFHPALRVPGVGVLFPPVAVDWESRPYHLGWILYAFNDERMARLRARSDGAPR